MSQPPVVQRALHVVIGPTAAGKSAVAMALAEHFNLAIVSADSRQLYRGFDIGTAKPTAADRARVRHFGIDVLEPVSRYSAHQWATDAASWMETARAEAVSFIQHPPDEDALRRAVTYIRENWQRRYGLVQVG